ncbi:hypothetical protein PMAYCL1PPCAC_28398, partial [Pristionchus mayeri]
LQNLPTTMSILEPTDEQKQGYLARIPMSEVFGDNILPGVVCTSEKILSLKDFPLDDNDVIIVSYPKSGTTWASELVSAIAHEGDIESIKQIRMDERVPWLELDDKNLPEGSPLHSSRRGKACPSAKKRVWFTHLHPEYLPLAAKQGKCKVIYVGRNPKDTAVSFYHFHLMAKFLGLQTSMTWNEFFPLFTSGFLCSGNWFKHATSYWKFCQENPKTARFLKFEEMKKDLMAEMVSLENFIGIPLSEDQRVKVVEHCSFGSMKSNKATNRVGVEMFEEKISSFMRKGIVGDWKNYFTVAQNEAFNELYKQKVAGTGLHFEGLE